MRAEAYADLARQYSTYVRDHGGNAVYRIAAGAHDDDVCLDRSLMEALTPFGTPLRRPGVFQGVSLHYYTTAGPWENKGSATVSTTTTTGAPWQRRAGSSRSLRRT